MTFKQVMSGILIIIGIIGLIIGTFGLFGKNMNAYNPWIFALLGLIFFSSGIGLLKSAGK